jgi:hypothetical protein
MSSISYRAAATARQYRNVWLVSSSGRSKNSRCTHRRLIIRNRPGNTCRGSDIACGRTSRRRANGNRRDITTAPVRLRPRFGHLSGIRTFPDALLGG